MQWLAYVLGPSGPVGATSLLYRKHRGLQLVQGMGSPWMEWRVELSLCYLNYYFFFTKHVRLISTQEKMCINKLTFVYTPENRHTLDILQVLSGRHSKASTAAK